MPKNIAHFILTNNLLTGELKPVESAISIIGGTILGPIAGRIIPTQGRRSDLFLPRNFSNFGLNSARITGQEGLTGLMGGIIDQTANNFTGNGQSRLLK